MFVYMQCDWVLVVGEIKLILEYYLHLQDLSFVNV